MIIEPTPTTPRSRRRRALRVVALVAPVVLLVAVIAAGTLGPRDLPSGAAPSAAELATSGAAPSAAFPVTAAASADPRLAQATPAAPEARPATPAPVDLAGLRGRTVAAVIEEPSTAPAGAVLAVSGYLRVEGPADPACEPAAADPMGPWCERRAVMADWFWGQGSPVVSPVPPFLPVTIPVGVRVPAPVRHAAERPAGGAHVLVVGRLAAAPGRCEPPRPCRPTLVVDRFAWADGVRAGLTPLIAERLDTGRRRANPFPAATGPDTVPLLAVLDWPEAIATLDASVAGTVARQPPSEPVWYVRLLVREPDRRSDRTIRWVLLAEPDLRVLGSGAVAGPGPDAGQEAG